jgi:hypothetical protein
MNIKLLPTLLFTLFAALTASAQFATPRAVVVDLYKKHDAKQSPFWQKKSRARVDRYFTKQLADLIWKDAHGPEDEAPILDGDPLYNAQDMKIKNFRIGTAVVKGNTATVPVVFTNFDKTEHLRFALQRTGTTWKIENIFYGGDENILKWLQAGNN